MRVLRIGLIVKHFCLQKKIFLDTFQISEGRLKRVLKYKNIFNGLRGRLPGSSRKICEEANMIVQDHINSFPKFEFH